VEKQLTTFQFRVDGPRLLRQGQTSLTRNIRRTSAANCD
jgi:hypothetical protein